MSNTLKFKFIFNKKTPQLSIRIIKSILKSKKLNVRNFENSTMTSNLVDIYLQKESSLPLKNVFSLNASVY